MKKYVVEIKPHAARELYALPKDVQQRIVAALERLEDGLSDDVKRLTNFTPEYRARVGDYRILFETEKARVIISYMSKARRL